MTRDICAVSYAASYTSLLDSIEGMFWKRGSKGVQRGFIRLIPVRHVLPRDKLWARSSTCYGRVIRIITEALVSSNLVRSLDMKGPCPPLLLIPDVFTTTPLETETLGDGELSPNSLFDEPQAFSTPPLKPPPGARTAATSEESDRRQVLTCVPTTIARRSAPPIPGLFFDPALLLPADLADSVLRSCITSFFAPHPGGGAAAGVNQVMLFSRAGREDAAFPPFLSALLAATSELLLQHPALPRETHALLFPPTHPQRDHHHHRQEEKEARQAPPRARQAIVNLYRPGEGITPHVDLLNRFGDGIVGVSLGGGAAMRFERAGTKGASETTELESGGQPYEVWLPPRSVLVLTGEARYEWTHGIASRTRDSVEDDGPGEGSESNGGWQWQERGVRVSVTFRWLLPGAEIVGGESDDDRDDDGSGDGH